MCNQTDVVFCSQVVPTPIVYMLGMELLMGACYLLGAVIYSNAVPEKWRPGMFDVWGHSHNIFHVLVVCGAYIHYKAALMLMADTASRSSSISSNAVASKKPASHTQSARLVDCSKSVFELGGHGMQAVAKS